MAILNDILYRSESYPNQFSDVYQWLKELSITSPFNPITQEDVDNVRAEVQEAGPILEEPPQKWIEVMRKWWKKLRDRRN